MDRQKYLLFGTLILLFDAKFVVPINLAPTVRLSSGYDMPIVGLGTQDATAKPGEREEAVKIAIDNGYRHIDTAYIYNNEVEVGRGVQAKINDGVIKREEIFITSKLWNSFHEPENVETAVRKSLENLNITYLDLYLIHWPMGISYVSKNKSIETPLSIDDVDLKPADTDGNLLGSDVDYVDTWRAMEKLVKNGLVRSIGISNFNSEQVNRLLATAEIKPVTNQVECHPNLNQRKLLKLLSDNNITLTAYSPLGRPHISKNLAITDTRVEKIADKYGKSPAQIILRYTIQNGAVVIPKSTNAERIKSNIDLFDFELSDDEMEEMNKLDSNSRLITFSTMTKHKYYPFNLEF